MIKTISKIFLTLMLLTSAVFAGEEVTQVRASHILVKTANDNGGKDNITVMIIEPFS